MTELYPPRSASNVICSSSRLQAGDCQSEASTNPTSEEFLEAASSDAHQLETVCIHAPVASHEVLLDQSAKDVCEELNSSGPQGVTFVPYESELQLPHVMRLMKADLSEPYSIYTYRYFIHNWPNLCFLVSHLHSCLGLPCRAWAMDIRVFGTCNRRVVVRIRFIKNKDSPIISHTHTHMYTLHTSYSTQICMAYKNCDYQCKP